MRKLSSDEFIEKAKSIHGNKYDYSLVEYSNCRTKVKIICPIHGVFEQKANEHMQGCGCRKCKYENLGAKMKLSSDEFIEKANKIHGDKYDYSLVEYKGNKNKVKIICPIHGVFEQIPNHHLDRGDGCPKCSMELKIQRITKEADKQKLTRNEFISRAMEVHGNKYDYSLAEYSGIFSKVKIICPIHGVFEQMPSNHIYNKGGCPKCNSSHGEMIIRNYLASKNMLFEEQKMFDNCKNIKKLKFDFYLPEKNICIEFQGRQHFEPFSFGEKSLEKFNKQIKNDNIKRDYCSKEGIELIEIKYDDVENIESIILAKLII